MWGLIGGTLLAAIVSDEQTSAPSTRAVLHKVTQDILDRMQRDGWFYGESREPRHDRPTPWHINCGWCDEWAELAAERTGGTAHDLAGDVRLQAHIAQQEGMLPVPQPTEADWSRYEDLIDAMPCHTVLLLDGRYYDSQHPDGVDDPSQLDLVCGVSFEDYMSRQP